MEGVYRSPSGAGAGAAPPPGRQSSGPRAGRSRSDQPRSDRLDAPSLARPERGGHAPGGPAAAARADADRGWAIRRVRAHGGGPAAGENRRGGASRATGCAAGGGAAVRRHDGRQSGVAVLPGSLELGGDGWRRGADQMGRGKGDQRQMEDADSRLGPREPDQLEQPRVRRQRRGHKTTPRCRFSRGCIRFPRQDRPIAPTSTRCRTPGGSTRWTERPARSCGSGWPRPACRGSGGT